MRSSLRQVISVSAGMAMLLVWRAASADYPAHTPYAGLSGGAVVPLRAWDLGTARPTPETSALIALRGGYQLGRVLAAEADVGWLPTSAEHGDTNATLTYGVSGLYHLLAGNVAPYAAAGGGFYHNVHGDLEPDIDPRLHVGLGLRALLAPWLAARAELREVITDGKDKTGAHNLEATLGVDLFVGGEEPAPPPDRDHDGVVDVRDACPREAGSEATAGCPDPDGDGIASADDGCPDRAGTPEHRGCPDQDDDAVVDPHDACPTRPGPAKLRGCPDADKDGIGDQDDRCPEQAGLDTFGGCPDQDDDGIEDAKDACPASKGTPELGGCADRDGDGALDPDDRCPEAWGLKEHAGCLPDAVRQFTGVIQGIQFADQSARLLPTSAKVLDQVASMLEQHPSLRIRIEAHTDDRGTAAVKQKLSDDRAAAVQAYLVGKGVAADRITAAGAGDSRPVREGTSAAARAANRRIEITPLH